LSAVLYFPLYGIIVLMCR